MTTNISKGELLNMNREQLFNLIKQQDEEGYQYIKKIANYLKDEPVYIDDHRRYNGKSSFTHDKIVIVRRYYANSNDTIYIGLKYKDRPCMSSVHKGVWCCPLYNGSYQCKNALYFDSDQVMHLSTWASGLNLKLTNYTEFTKTNKSVQDVYGFCGPEIEVNLSFTANELLKLVDS